MWTQLIMGGALAIAVILAATWIMMLNRDPKTDFNAMRLLMSKGQDGIWRESRRAIGELVAIIVSTWGFVFLVVGGKLTEWYMGSWMAILLGWSVAKKMMEAKGGNDSSDKADRK